MWALAEKGGTGGPRHRGHYGDRLNMAWGEMREVMETPGLGGDSITERGE